MTTELLVDLKKDILKKGYEHSRWLDLVQHVFKNKDIFSVDGYKPLLTDVAHVERAFQYGLVYLSDDRRLALVDVELTDAKVIARNRVELRELAAKLITGGFNGVLVVFHTAGQYDYRLSLITKISAFDKDGVFVTEQTYPKRYTYLLGPNESCTTADRQLNALATNTRPTLEDVVNAFSVEKVSTEFFKEYKYHYEKKFLPHVEKLANANSQLFPVADDLISKKEQDEVRKKQIRDFTKRLLGRIVFLYFVQKKSWLGASLSDTDYQHGGDTNFLRTLFDEANQTDATQFYARDLAPLFFDTLNSPERSSDEFTMPSGRKVRVPYLNGGLFDEQDEPDRYLISFPPTLFHQPERRIADTPNERGLLDFMNSFNFTIYEDSPDDLTVAVDPEMLGHIFENLLEENREKGAIYTPREVVHFMCQESLTDYLTTHLTEPADRDHIRQVVQEKRVLGVPRQLLDAIDDRLKKVRICDPAIGSGAFPVGLLQEIFAIKEAIRYEEGFKPESRARVKEDIIQRSIYGVDIEPGAVEIARLRFWLSLIVDEVKPRPLPNLDFKIVVGDSLVPKYERTIVNIDWNTLDTSGNQHFLEEIKKTLKEISHKQQDFFKPEQDGYFLTPAEKKRALADIRRLKIKFLVNQLALTKLRYEATNAVATGRLFAPTKKEQALQRQIAGQVQNYDTQIQKLNALEHQTNRPLHFFDWKLDFAEVMNETVAGTNTGFDIVIANPPYMRIQGVKQAFAAEDAYYKADKDLKEVAKQAYDLANLFVVLALKKLSHANTVNCFIFPHKFFNSDSATDFREFLMRGQYMDKITHFGANRVFNEVDTYVCIALFSRRQNDGFRLQKLPYMPDRDRKTTRLPDQLVRLMTDNDQYEYVAYDQLRRASKLYNGNQWLFFDGPAGYKLFETIYQAGSQRFSDVFEIFVGLQTSNDKLYLLDVTRQDDHYFWGTNQVSKTVWQVERKFFKPMLRGRDVQRYAPLQTDNYVFFPYQLTGKKATPVPLSVFEKSYPFTYRYVMEQADVFKDRESSKMANDELWYRHGRENNLAKFEQIKLSSMEICTSHANVTLDENQFYHSTTVYSWVKAANVSESYEYLLAIANSPVLWWFLKNTSDTLQGDARRLKSNYLNPFPLPNRVAPATEQAIAMLVRCLLWLGDFANPPVNPSVSNKSIAAYLRQVVDGCVCELYVGEEMRQKKIDILPFVERDVAVSTGEIDPGAINKLFLGWQQPESEVRNRLKLFTTRSPDVIARLLNA